MPSIHWHKDGRELKNNARINISHLPNGVSSLYISRALLEDAGVYQVIASNANGLSVYYAEIHVERKSKLNSFFFKLEIQIQSLSYHFIG